jgi:CHAT domain-containing protein
MRAFYSSLKNCSDVTCAMQAGREAVRNYKTNYGIMRFNPASMAMSYEEGIVNPYDAPYYWAPFILIED